MLFGRFIRIIKANLLSKEADGAKPVNEQYTHTQDKSTNYQESKKQTTGNTIYGAQERKYYDALEITPGASFAEIKASYKKLVKKYHPDIFHNNTEKRRYAEIVTQQLNEAYNYFEQKYGGKT